MCARWTAVFLWSVLSSACLGLSSPAGEPDSGGISESNAPGTDDAGTPAARDLSDAGDPGVASDASQPSAPSDLGNAPPPVPTGCITAVTAGTHTFSCQGYPVDVGIPASCPAKGCGLILELHGDEGTGPWMDAHTRLLTLGPAAGYVVLAPTAKPIGVVGGVAYPGSSWAQTDDAAVIQITQSFISVFHLDPSRIHVSGFSRGGMMTWRLLCDNANLFASAAAGGAGPHRQALNTNPEVECFEPGHVPSRHVDVLQLAGLQDMTVAYSTQLAIRNSAITQYGGNPATRTVVASNASFSHYRWAISGGATIEAFEHNYVLPAASAFAAGVGHCIPGSTVAASANYPVACQALTGFVWGPEMITFFNAHQKP
jgi:polyhydroxybutyrate depolymerase